MADAAPSKADLALVEAILRTLGMPPVDGLGAALAPPPPASPRRAQALLAPQLRIGRHFDIRPAAAVVSSATTTFGIVQVARPTAEAPDPHRQVRRFVDEATYLSHLFRADAEESATLPWSVELVLVAPDRAARDVISEELRKVIRTTACLHAIGINLLPADAAGAPEANACRRAFPWLLDATARWYEHIRSRRTAAPGSKLSTLALDGYRLAGTRVLELAAGPAVHLVHGQNGSGKSALAESVELIVTGRIERLDEAGEKDYVQVIRNRETRQPPRIVAGFRGGWRQELAVVPGGIATPLASKLAATGFRLDQTLMDRLTRRGDAQRATTFLEAFFPEDRETYERYRAAVARVEALPRVPGETPPETAAAGPEPRAEAAIRQLQWLAQPALPLTVAPADQLLPLPIDRLRATAALDPSLAAVLDGWAQAPPVIAGAEAALDELDRAVEEARPGLERAAGRLDQARTILGRVGGWRAAATARPGAIAGETAVNRLNDWLRAMALADLLSRQHDVARAMLEARRLGYRADGASGAELLARGITEADAGALARHRDFWTSERQRLRDEVSGTRRTSAHAPSPAPALAFLSAEDIAVLDEAGAWLVPSAPGSASPGLGALLNEALTWNTPVTFGRVSIGEDGWAAALSADVDSLVGSARALAHRTREESGLARLGTSRESLASSRELVAASVAVRSTFLSRIRRDAGPDQDPRLNEALNELMALFTPARWNYDDVALVYRQTGGGGAQLQLSTADDARAELRFNTAELNVFTLSLFLLGGVGRDNPLGLLVLDDPLQNMDELTVTSVARGLGKVARHFPEGWELLILFHGEDDLERFRRELPAAVYALPWLPHGTAEKVVIAAQADGAALAPQDLAELIEEVVEGAGPDPAARTPSEAAPGKAPPESEASSGAAG